MSTVASSEPRIQDVCVTEDEIVAHLTDGRVISVPLAWSWRLAEATPEQRSNFRLIGSGHGVHWPDLDEDISVEGMLHGIPARRPTSGRLGTGTLGVHEPSGPLVKPTRGTPRARGRRGGAPG